MKKRPRILPPPRELPCWALAALVALAPLPSGGVTPQARTGLWIALFVLLAVVARRDDLGVRLRPAWQPAAAFGALAALGWLQSLPWPAPLAALISPEHLAHERGAAAALGEAPGWPHLSLSPEISRGAALTFAALAAAWLVAVAEGRPRYRRRRLMAAVLVAGLLQPLWGLARTFSEDSPRLTGTFVNPDHSALLIEMALAAAFGWAVAVGRSTLERRFLALAPPVAIWLFLWAALIVSGSRAGLLAAAGGALGQAVLLALATRKWRPLLIGGGALATAFGLVVAIGLRGGLDRLRATSTHALLFNERLAAWGETIELFPRFPLLGSGLGTFLEAFPLVQSAEMSGLRWVRAHNGYLELLVTGGLVALAVAAWGLSSVLRRLWDRLRRPRRRDERALALAASGALISVGLHELVDFGLALPANALALTVMTAAAVAPRWRKPDPTS